VPAGGELVQAVQFAEASPAPLAANTAASNPGTTGAASQVPASDAARPPGGWLAVAAPFPVTLRDRSGRLLGTSTMRRIPLTTGDQQVEFANADLGYSSRQTVRVDDGGTTRIEVAPPSAALSVNAIPWAEVSIDGRSLGETPIGDLTETIGDHQLEFRHPELGTKRVTVRVTLKEPARVSVDMRAP
jgi:hypothetical protein